MKALANLIEQAIDLKSDRIDIFEGVAYFMKGGSDLEQMESDLWLEGKYYFSGNLEEISYEEYVQKRNALSLVISTDTEFYGDQMTISILNN